MSQSISTVVRMMLLLGGEGTWRLPHPTQDLTDPEMQRQLSHLHLCPEPCPGSILGPWPVDEETDSESSGGLPEVTKSMKGQQNPGATPCPAHPGL